MVVATTARTALIAPLPSQVIAAFSVISRGTGDKGHPQPAATFASALSATNLEVLHFIPMSCVVSSTMDFYWQMCFRAVVPVGAIFVLWLWPLSCVARRKPYTNALRKTVKFTLSGLEVITPSVATAVMQTFACDEYDSGWFLRAELTLACDGSMRRQRWIFCASFFTLIYPVGVPLLIFTTMYCHRKEINKLQLALKENDSRQTEVVSARRLSAELSIKQRRPSIVASVDGNLSWIVKKFERFNPGRWYTLAFLLTLRILQTSVLVLIPHQNIQVLIVVSSLRKEGEEKLVTHRVAASSLAVHVSLSCAGRRGEPPWNARRLRAPGSTTLPTDFGQ